MTTPDSTVTLTGGLYSVTPRITRQGRRWLTADLVFDDPDGKQVRHEVRVYPGAHEALVEHIVAGATTTITVAAPCLVTEMTIAGHHWRDTASTKDVTVAGLRLPSGPDPIPVARILQAIKRDAGFLFDPRHLPGSRKPKLALLLFFMQGHHLAFHHKPLFTGPIYATAGGVSLALPDPTGDFPGNVQWGTVGQVLLRYGRMHLADLRSLVRVSDAWQAARDGSRDGEIDHALLDAWFSRDEECNDPDDERPTRRETAVFGREHRAEADERREAQEKNGQDDPTGDAK